MHVHPFGLHSIDQELPLYMGDGDIGQASVLRRDVNVDASEVVQLRAAGPWTQTHGIDRIDVLKVDVEGCEVDVIESLRTLLPTVKVLYVEYDSREAARYLERTLDPTHELFSGAMLLDQGECVYVRSDTANRDGAGDRLREIGAMRFAGRGID